MKLICQALNKSFAQQQVVKNLSFSLSAGRILALLGPSGCGKTTTLRLIAGFEKLDSGRIEIDRQEVANGRSHIPTEKRRIGMVFQDYAIFPHLSVGDNVGFGLPRRASSKQTIEELLDFVGLHGLRKKMPHELSGGQQQRVALARALALEPAVLLLDEPFSNLDAALRKSVRQEVRHLLKQRGATAIFVTHDQEEAMFLGDDIGVMNNGRLEQLATPETIFHQPRTRFVAEFMGDTDFLTGTVTSQGIETPLGILPCASDEPDGTAVELAIRPDDITLTASANGQGRILQRQFIGIAYLYDVQLADGSILRSWEPHERQLSEGTAVQITIPSPHTLPIFPKS